MAAAATIGLTAVESIIPFKTTTPTPTFAQNITGGNMTLDNLTASNVNCAGKVNSSDNMTAGG